MSKHKRFEVDEEAYREAERLLPLQDEALSVCHGALTRSRGSMNSSGRLYDNLVRSQQHAFTFSALWYLIGLGEQARRAAAARVATLFFCSLFCPRAHFYSTQLCLVFSVLVLVLTRSICCSASHAKEAEWDFRRVAYKGNASSGKCMDRASLQASPSVCCCFDVC